MVRINNGKNSYLYCSVSDNASDWSDAYDSSEECYEDIREDIIDSCKQRGYTDTETKTVLSHYEIYLSNWGG